VVGQDDQGADVVGQAGGEPLEDRTGQRLAEHGQHRGTAQRALVERGLVLCEDRHALIQRHEVAATLARVDRQQRVGGVLGQVTGHVTAQLGVEALAQGL
jgi:hypothetical protein